MILGHISTIEELKSLINEIGFIPLFRSSIEGFSVEDITDKGMWWTDGVIGPWDWRETLAASGEIVYAKLFHGKAGFFSLDAYPDFVNFRRDGYDFDSRVEDGLVSARERKIYSLIKSGVSVSGDLRKAYADKGFDSALNHLQMLTYITVKGFTRKLDRFSQPYGWSISCYDTPENFYGDSVTGCYDKDAAESLNDLAKRLHSVVPDADAEKFFKI